MHGGVLLRDEDASDDFDDAGDDLDGMDVDDDLLTLADNDVWVWSQGWTRLVASGPVPGARLKHSLCTHVASIDEIAVAYDLHGDPPPCQAPWVLPFSCSLGESSRMAPHAQTIGFFISNLHLGLN